MAPPKDIDVGSQEEELGAFPPEGAEPAELHAYVERYSQRFEAQIPCVPVSQRALEPARAETEIVDGGTVELEDDSDVAEVAPEPVHGPSTNPAASLTFGGRTLRLGPNPGDEEAPNEPVVVPMDRGPRRWLVLGALSIVGASTVAIGVLGPSRGGPEVPGLPVPLPTVTAAPAAASVAPPPSAVAAAVTPSASAPALAPSAASSFAPRPPKRDGGVALPPTKPPPPLPTVGPLFDNDDE